MYCIYEGNHFSINQEIKLMLVISIFFFHFVLVLFIFSCSEFIFVALQRYNIVLKITILVFSIGIHSRMTTFVLF